MLQTLWGGGEFRTTFYASMAMDATSGKSMASRLRVSRATKHIQLPFLYTQDLVAAGVVRLRKVPTRDTLLWTSTTSSYW